MIHELFSSLWWLPSSLLLSSFLPLFFSRHFSLFKYCSLPLKINHKYPERRLLVAESCGALAPYLPVRTHHAHKNKTDYLIDWIAVNQIKPGFLSLQKEIRSSLVLSMLQQMLAEDKADMVREAVIKSLGIIMGYIDDPDKYSQVCLPFLCTSLCLIHGLQTLFFKQHLRNNIKKHGK